MVIVPEVLIYDTNDPIYSNFIIIPVYAYPFIVNASFPKYPYLIYDNTVFDIIKLIPKSDVDDDPIKNYNFPAPPFNPY